MGGSVKGQRKSRWPEETIEEIRTMITKGKLTAKQVGDKLGVTRSTILGLMHRNGIPGSMNAARGPQKPRAPKAPRQKAPPAAPERPVTVAPIDPATLAAQSPDAPPGAREWTTRRRNECAYPYEVGQDYYSCCAVVERDGDNYCKKHRKVMFDGIPQTSRTQEQVPRRHGRRAA